MAAQTALQQAHLATQQLKCLSPLHDPLCQAASFVVTNKPNDDQASPSAYIGMDHKSLDPLVTPIDPEASD